MIARSLFMFLLMIVIPSLYLDFHYLSRRLTISKRIIYWIPTLLMVAYTIVLAFERNFIPDNIYLLYIYLLLLGLVVIPKLVFALCSICGLAWCRLTGKRRNYGNLAGLAAVPLIWFVLLYGAFIGFEKMEVNRYDYISTELPKSFDGYRIVQFSDAHVGTYSGSMQHLLKQAVDSINALKPDLIVFTGDLQNVHPSELYKQMDILSGLKAKDGVYAVLGNHDYAEYVDCSTAQKVANCRETISLEKQMGWTVLLNEHRIINRGNSHIVLAGMENDGDGKHFPQKGDIRKTLAGTAKEDFIVMLEHDPSSWRRKILPESCSQLTLSGHTHGGQFMIGDWSPLALAGKEWNGWYKEGRQSLFVSKGLGGLIPFRFGATGEIVLISLKVAR